MYMKVNAMVGDIVKVTPSSKMVGDLAISWSERPDPENIVEKVKTLRSPILLYHASKG